MSQPFLPTNVSALRGHWGAALQVYSTMKLAIKPVYVYVL